MLWGKGMEGLILSQIGKMPFRITVSLVYGKKFMISISRGLHVHSHMTSINHSEVLHNAVIYSAVLM